jgi:hypothetical protein
MGKSKSRVRHNEDTVWVALDDIYLTEAVIHKLLARDRGQIEAMRADFENGVDMVRVVLHDRVGGGYNIDDGRHRVLAAKLAGIGFIEAVLTSR